MARQNYDLFIYSFFAHDSSVIWHKSNHNSVMDPRRMALLHNSPSPNSLARTCKKDLVYC